MAVHVIAEAGSNYNGSVALAKRLNESAVGAGADSVKYQIINTDLLYRPGSYTYGHYRIEDIREIRRRDELPDESWRLIFADARARGISCSASVFDERGLDLLDSFDPPYIKLASCDLNNHSLLRLVAARRRRMVLSTGMATLDEIDRSVSVLDSAGINGSNLVLLHCVSVYPSPLSETNLHYVELLANRFGCEVGFSDHTMGPEAACVAVALGATWIEKHFTIDSALDGLDHKHAAEPEVLARYIRMIRETEQSLLLKPEKVGADEAYTKQRARRGIYASRDLQQGHIVTDTDLEILRPEGPLSADLVDEVVGIQLRRSVRAHEPFLPEDLPTNSKR
jgi:N,N'-diacetyllegionaminate synthase